MFALAGCNEESSTGESSDNSSGQNDSSSNNNNDNDNDNDTSAGALPGAINFTPLGGFNGIYVRLSGADVTNTNYVLRDARGEGFFISNGAGNGTHRNLRFSLINTVTPKVLNYFTDDMVDQLPAAFTGTTRVNSAIVQVPWTLGPGTFQCSADTIFQINNVNADSCTIEVSYITRSGGVAGRVVTASFSSPVAYTVTDTPFRVYQHKGTAGEPGNLARRGFASLYIDPDQNTFELPGDQHFILNNNPSGATSVGVSPIDGTNYFTGNADDTLRMDFTGISAATVSTTCNGNIRKIDISVGRYQGKMLYTTNRTGGSCTLTQLELNGGFYVVQYEAILIAPSADGVPEDQRELRISGQYANFMLSNEDLGADNSGDEGELGDQANAMVVEIDAGNNMFVEGHRYLIDDTGNHRSVDVTESEGFFTIYMSRRYRQALNFTVQVREIPTALGTYQCSNTYTGAGDSETIRRPQVVASADQGFDYSSTDGFGVHLHTIAGASCTVVVTGVTEESITGTYLATLLVRNAAFRTYLEDDGTLEVSGQFRVER